MRTGAAQVGAGGDRAGGWRQRPRGRPGDWGGSVPRPPTVLEAWPEPAQFQAFLNAIAEAKVNVRAAQRLLPVYTKGQSEKTAIIKFV